MKALIAFIILGLIVLTLTEINERLKAKRAKEHPELAAGNQQKKDDSCVEACTECGLLEVCEKEEKGTKKK